MALLRPDHGARTVEGEALFVVAGDDLFELLPAYGESPAGGRLEERVHRHPTVGRELEPELLRAVPQILAQVFTQNRASPVFVSAHVWMLARLGRVRFDARGAEVPKRTGKIVSKPRPADRRRARGALRTGQ